MIIGYALRKRYENEKNVTYKLEYCGEEIRETVFSPDAGQDIGLMTRPEISVVINQCELESSHMILESSGISVNKLVELLAVESALMIRELCAVGARSGSAPKYEIANAAANFIDIFSSEMMGAYSNSSFTPDRTLSPAFDELMNEYEKGEG